MIGQDPFRSRRHRDRDLYVIRRYEAVHAGLGGKHDKGEVERLDVRRAILARD